MKASHQRLEIGTAAGTTPGRPLMSDHNFSARIWATCALIVIPFISNTTLSWWLPIHLALLGAVTQAIVGGQLMFSATLGLSRGPSRRMTLAQLASLNLGAAAVIAGRAWASRPLLGAGACLLLATTGWVTVQVHQMWKRSVNRRFSITGRFYLLAGVSLLMGGSIGGAMAIGAFDDGGSYVAHRGVHMTLNIFGWAGMTILGTAITLLPTILHVRAPQLTSTRAVPWLMFGGLMTVSTGATVDVGWLTGLGMTIYVFGLISFGLYLKAVLTTSRRRRVPVAAGHLIAALMWAFMTSLALVVTGARGDYAAGRDLLVVGGAFGFAIQALLGAWSFLLPSTRAPIPQQRRDELVAMELGGRTQLIVYNVGLVTTLFGLLVGSDLSLAGTVATWIATAWLMTKAWAFPLLAKTQIVKQRSARWWAEPQTTP